MEDDHIDLEWFTPQRGTGLWSTLAQRIPVPLHVNPAGETVRVGQEDLFRQITERIQVRGQVLGYLRVSHPWFEVTKPSRRLILDLALGTSLMVGAVAAIGWLLSGIAMAPSQRVLPTAQAVHRRCFPRVAQPHRSDSNQRPGGPARS